MSDQHRIHRVIVGVAVGLGVLNTQPATAQTGELFVLVTDQQTGEPVAGMTADQFQISVGDAPRSVLSAEPATTPMKIALLVDNSDAVGAGELNSLRNGLTAFLTELPEQHAVSLITIGGTVRQEVDFTTDRAELRDRAEGLFAGRGAAKMIEGLMETWDRRFEENDAWPVFVCVVTDGPEGSGNVTPSRFNEFAAGLVARGVMVHSVLLSTRGGGVQTQITSILANNTGGVHKVLASSTHLPEGLTALASAMGNHFDDVSRRYRVLYERAPDSVGAPVTAGVVGATGYRLRLFADRRMPPQ